MPVSDESGLVGLAHVPLTEKGSGLSTNCPACGSDLRVFVTLFEPLAHTRIPRANIDFHYQSLHGMLVLKPAHRLHLLHRSHPVQYYA